ncbi:hypothetical protein ACFY93_12775 [Streptomyces sp. NPDC008313]|uniref:hypothetical protein n=1 Tax=Streptomyces sp. NPDC008313 TaxID=3364826 RepID=UPI0036ECC670
MSNQGRIARMTVLIWAEPWAPPLCSRSGDAGLQTALDAHPQHVQADAEAAEAGARGADGCERGVGVRRR